MLKKTINDIEVKEKVCIVRVDYNVPISDCGKIMDDTRIKESFPTIHNLKSRGAKIVLVSHLGRPQGTNKENLKLEKIANHLSNLLDIESIPVHDYNNKQETKQKIQDMGKGEIIMLENIRFHPNEKKDPDSFGAYLAQFGDIFINEAFSVSHRKHGSVTGITKYLPSVAGIHLQHEEKYIKNFTHTKKPTPYVVIIGGKKSKDKIPVMTELIDRADTILIAGGIANTFLKARGYDIGNSFYEKEMIDIAKKICYKALQTNTAIMLPTDVVVTDNLETEPRSIRTVKIDQIPENYMAVDIGPETIQKYGNVIEKAGSILRTGPVGVYRYPEFRKGNDSIVDAISKNKASCLAGGGDTLASIKNHEKKHFISHISTGGGATLHYIQEGSLPGIESLHNL